LLQTTIGFLLNIECLASSIVSTSVQPLINHKSLAVLGPAETKAHLLISNLQSVSA